MLALGVLDEGRTGDPFAADTSSPVRPGSDAPMLVSTHQRFRTVQKSIAAEIVADAEQELTRAKRLAEGVRSTVTLVALAQAHAVLDEREEALHAAREALHLSLAEKAVENGRAVLTDPVSARLAAEVMVRYGEASEAFDLLHSVTLPNSLRMTLAVLAVELGRLDDASAALEGVDGSLAESFRGFLLAAQGEFQKAIPHLRLALRTNPNDADAAMNLSVALWEVGAQRKAVATALRASRTAPGRRDISLHYLELLLSVGDLKRLKDEISSLELRQVIPDARLLVIQARAALTQDTGLPRAIGLLEEALLEAEAERDDVLRTEIAANLTALKLRMGRLTHDQAIAALSRMLSESKGHEAVVMCLAKITSRSSEASLLRRAVEQLADGTSPARRAFLAYQLAWLEGDNERAGSGAAEWFDLEPRNAQAAATALVALGIGQERWIEAAAVADFAVAHFPDDFNLVNNAGYILAMAGRASEAIELLEPMAVNEFVARATLGLACLAKGEVERGMRLYREAAEDAERTDRSMLSLMTIYQALIVKQLGIDKHGTDHLISALALASVPLPPDWEERPDFIRLLNVCIKHGYGWPVTI